MTLETIERGDALVIGLCLHVGDLWGAMRRLGWMERRIELGMWIWGGRA
jgi:hypothetical protein